MHGNTDHLTVRPMEVEPDKASNLLDDAAQITDLIDATERLLASIEHAVDPGLVDNTESAVTVGMTAAQRPALGYALNGQLHRLGWINNRLRALCVRIGADG